MANDATAIQYGKDIAVRIADYSDSNALPAVTVAWDGTWGGTWTAPGYTNGGLHVATDVTYADVEVDQEFDPVAKFATARSATMNTQLSQFDLDIAQDSSGQGTIATLAATTAARGYDQWDLNSTIDETGIAVGFDIKGRDGEPIRIFGPRGFPNAGMTWDFEKNSTTGVLTPLSVQLTPSPGHGNLVMRVVDVTPIAA